ncbi:MAG: PEP-CTERM sorting domain-containing protein [Stellaceae bacterium]
MRPMGVAANVSLAAVAALWLGTAVARADTVLWIDDTGNNIGTVDLTTGTTTVIGNANNGDTLTDIGFTADKTLYGTSFSNLYSINQSTGAATLVSALGVGGNGMNALVGDGGNLLAASSVTTSLYRLTPSPYSAVTFTGSTGAASAGDLAFAGGTLYESGVAGDGHDELIALTLSGNSITNATVIGEFNQSGNHFTGVFGLADDGTTMYAVNGTTVYSVDLTDAALTTVSDYSGHGLTTANGTAFINEGSAAVPEPSSLALMASGLIGLFLFGRFFAGRRTRGTGAAG